MIAWRRRRRKQKSFIVVYEYKHWIVIHVCYYCVKLTSSVTKSVKCRLWSMNFSLKSRDSNFKDLYLCSFFTMSNKSVHNLLVHFFYLYIFFCYFFFYRNTISWFAQGIQIQKYRPYIKWFNHQYLCLIIFQTLYIE